jgi:ABC-type transport system substrate-binding protein
MMYQDWKRNRRLVLIRNPDYWGHPFNFNKVIYNYISNPNTVVRKLLREELDRAGIQRKDQYLELKDHELVAEGKVVLGEYDYPGYRYIGYNFNRELFKDRNVRWALSHAVPVQRIIDEVWKGLAVPVAGPFLPGSSASDDTIKPVPYDLDRSIELLEEAGWRDTDRDGVRDRMIGGVKVDARFELMIYADAPQYDTLAAFIKENCRKIGVDVRIQPTKWALMLQKLRKRDFDAAMLGWVLSWESDPKQIWHSSQADVPDSSNHIAYANPELDKLIDKLQVTLDEDKQIDLYHRIHRVIFEDQPYTFLFQDKATAGRLARIKNVHYYKIRPCVDAREWYVGEPPKWLVEQQEQEPQRGTPMGDTQSRERDPTS